MKRPLPATVVLAATLWCGLACAFSGPTSPLRCTDAVSVSVRRGSQPMIEWLPGCGVASITVAIAGDGLTLPLWQAFAPATGMGPPIGVETSPPGALVWGSGEKLTFGASYTVYVVRGGRGDPTAGVDSRTFISQPWRTARRGMVRAGSRLTKRCTRRA